MVATMYYIYMYYDVPNLLFWNFHTIAIHKIKEGGGKYMKSEIVYSEIMDIFLKLLYSVSLSDPLNLSKIFHFSRNNFKAPTIITFNLQIWLAHDPALYTHSRPEN